MKVLKIIGGIILLLFLALAIASMATENNYTVERSTEVKKSISETFDYVADYNNYPKWNPWAAMEPSATFTVTGTAGEVGMKYAWNGEIIGVGSITMAAIETNKSIDGDLVFLEPFESQSKDLWEFTEIDSTTTKISWRVEGEMGFLVNLMIPSLKEDLGVQFEQGLVTLKEQIEALPPMEKENQESEEN